MQIPTKHGSPGQNPNSGARGGSTSNGTALSGPAAVVAPASAFAGGIPPDALVVIPLSAPTPELQAQLAKGAVAITPEEMWKLLGFNGPAVQITDNQGRPIAIGLNDFVAGLQKSWDEAPNDVNRGRMLVQELLKYSRFEQAEAALQKLLTRGGNGEDRLALGIAQMNQQKLDEAEESLKKAQSQLPKNPYPTMHLARVARQWNDRATERQRIQQAISIDANCLDAWEYLFELVRELDGEDKAGAAIEELAKAGANQKTVAPFVAVSRVYGSNDATQEKALAWAKKAVARNANDPLAVVALSSYYGRSRNFDEAIKLLALHEAKMTSDLGLANNYFLALFEARRLEAVTHLLNVLAASPNREIKEYAAERSQLVAQYLQQQQMELSLATQRQG